MIELYNCWGSGTKIFLEGGLWGGVCLRKGMSKEEGTRKASIPCCIAGLPNRGGGEQPFILVGPREEE